MERAAQWRDLLYYARGGDTDRSLARALQHVPPAQLAELPVTSSQSRLACPVSNLIGDPPQWGKPTDITNVQHTLHWFCAIVRDRDIREVHARAEQPSTTPQNWGEAIANAVRDLSNNPQKLADALWCPARWVTGGS